MTRRVRAAMLGVAMVGTVLVAPIALPFGGSAASAQTSFTFVGGGYGHGVGMSQYGARGRADAGQSAAQILGAYYQGTAITAASPAGPRVHLDDTASVELSVPVGNLTATVDAGAAFSVANPGEHVVLRISGANVTSQVVSPTVGAVTTVAGASGIAIGWTQGSALTVSSTGQTYQWGRLVVKPHSGSLQLVLDSISMDQYLYGLGEVPSSWPVEALRTQAIAGRTYAAYRLAHPQSTDFDLYASVSDQAYVGASKAAGTDGARWVQAVNDTTGQVITYNGTIIQAFYSSSNGGSSENSDYVWAATLPYLRAVADPWDHATGNSNYSWSETYSDTELEYWVAASGHGDVGPVTGVSIGGNVGASGRVDKATVTVSGRLGSASMTGNQFRSAINTYAASSRDLLSTKFGIAAPPATAPGADPTPVSPQGRSDLIASWGDSAVMAGWSADSNAPASPVTLVVSVDGRLAGTGVANLHYVPLIGNGIFGAEHGYMFGVRIPAALVTVCVAALNIGAPAGNPVLGCARIDHRPAKAVKKSAAKKKVVKKKVVKKRR